MGTRSTTTVFDGEKPILSFYRQFDGYLSGHGQDLADFLKGRSLVNGLSGPMTFNGPGDLAMRLVAHLKNRQDGGDGGETTGGFYAIAHDETGQEDYHYDIIVVGVRGLNPDGTEGIRVRVKSFGTLIAEGAPDEFVGLAEAAESDD